MTNLKLLAGLLLSPLLCWPLQAQDLGSAPLSMESAINYALANDNRIQNARIQIEDAELQIKERLSTGLPQVNAGLDFQHYLQVPVQAIPEEFLPPGSEGPTEVSFLLKNNFTANVGFRTMIFDGSFFVGLRAAREARSYYQLELENEERTVRNQVINAYLPVLLLNENLKILDRNIDNLQTLLNETSALQQAGFVEQLDVDRLVLSLDNLQTERNNLDRNQENVMRALKYAINYPMDQQLRVEDNLEGMVIEIDAADLESEIPFARRPEVRLLEKGIALQDLNVELQRSAFLPTVFANASYQYQFQGNTLNDGFWAPTGVIGLSANIPIYDFGGRSARVERARLERETIINQRNDLVRGIELEVRNARTAFESARESLEARERSLGLAERIYETTQIKYREGVGSSLEVVQAEQELYQAQANQLNAIYDLLVAKESLYQALGQP
ncbi:MAG: TolC family protein [Bacteroidota bacterium]